MKRLNIRRGPFAGSGRTWLSIAALVVASGTAHAGFTPGASLGTVNYSLDYTGGAGTTPMFDTDLNSTTYGQLITPGGGFPILFGTTEGNPAQSGSGTLAPFPLVVQSMTGSSGNTVPVPFGTATTAIFSMGAGSQGALTTQGGIFWDTRTSLVDGLRGIDAGLASLSYSTATSVFTNSTTAAITINPGSILSVRGSVGGTGGSYVAAGLYSSYQLSGSSTVVTNTGIALAANASGQTVNLTGNVPGDATSISYFNNQLFVTATSFFGAQPISIGVGQSITIKAELTLISDPMSSLTIVSDLAPGFPTNAPLPDFGAFAGGTVFTGNVVPEPSTIVMLGLGLASAGAWCVRARGRRADRA